MYIRFKLFGHRIVFYSRKVIPILGINSTLRNGKHMPMIETDYCNIRELETIARNMQDEYKLGDAYILNTGRDDSYHLIFFSGLSWRDCVKVCTSCPRIDMKHLYFSLQRVHFTLRLSKKAGRKLDVVSIIKSQYSNTCSPLDLQSYVIYETAVRI